MIRLNFTPFPTLHTERLMLRPLYPEDLQPMYRMRANPAVMQYIPRAPAASPADAQALIDKINGGIAQNEAIIWAMALKENPQLIGTIGFHIIDPENRSAQIGYMLDPASWGKGLMREALDTVMRYARRQLQVRVVDARVHRDNKASVSLLLKYGFQESPGRKEDLDFEGTLFEMLIYSFDFDRAAS